MIWRVLLANSVPLDFVEEVDHVDFVEDFGLYSISELTGKSNDLDEAQPSRPIQSWSFCGFKRTLETGNLLRLGLMLAESDHHREEESAKELPSRPRAAARAWPGLRHVNKCKTLRAEIWTDYTVHDPGITILELLAYSLGPILVTAQTIRERPFMATEKVD